jgi:hypothetical protein
MIVVRVHGQRCTYHDGEWSSRNASLASVLNGM